MFSAYFCLLCAVSGLTLSEFRLLPSALSHHFIFFYWNYCDFHWVCEWKTCHFHNSHTLLDCCDQYKAYPHFRLTLPTVLHWLYHSTDKVYLHPHNLFSHFSKLIHCSLRSLGGVSSSSLDLLSLFLYVFLKVLLFLVKLQANLISVLHRVYPNFHFFTPQQLSHSNSVNTNIQHTLYTHQLTHQTSSTCLTNCFLILVNLLKSCLSLAWLPHRVCLNTLLTLPSHNNQYNTYNSHNTNTQHIQQPHKRTTLPTSYLSFCITNAAQLTNKLTKLTRMLIQLNPNQANYSTQLRLTIHLASKNMTKSRFKWLVRTNDVVKCTSFVQ